MTAAQRRTVTVRIGGDAHRVEITAEVREADELVKLATVAYHETNAQPRSGMGFGSQHVERTQDRQFAGSPLYHYGNEPVTAKEVKP